MAAETHEGSCACGACGYTIALDAPLNTYQPRACDCDYCTARGIAYLSAPTARITLTATRPWQRERQGSEQAEFLSCPHCADVLAVIARFEHDIRGAVNGRLLKESGRLGGAVTASPKSLEPATKRERWRTLWGRVQLDEVAMRGG